MMFAVFSGRAVSRLAVYLLLSAAVLAPASLFAGEQAERAIAAVGKLRSDGLLPSEPTLRIVAKQGNIYNFWGLDFSLKKEWEEKTGIRLDLSTRPQRPVLQFMADRQDFDLTVARQREYPDLYSRGLIADLTPLFDKYGFSLPDSPPSGYFLLPAQSTFDDRAVAVPADGDIAILYLRSDLLDDAEMRKLFLERHHRELRAPETWSEYQALIEFFHQPAAGFYGSCEEREPETGWMFWMPRYLSMAGAEEFLFDGRMRPLIDSAAGIAATESYVATVPFSPPEILEKGNNYSYTVPLFKKGQCFANIITLAGAKLYNMPRSPVRKKFIGLPLPGSRTADGGIFARSSFIYGNNLVLARSSDRKDLAFLYAMWLTDPDISLRSILNASGFADPYRFNHLDRVETRSIYTKTALQSLRTQLPRTAPAGTGLPGDSEYIAILNRNLWLAARQDLTPRQAMERTAASWEEITDRYGRDKQIRHWRQFRRKFPTAEASTALP